jgi:hypothetical protein
MSTLNFPDRAGTYRLTLSIGMSNGEQSDEMGIDELVDGWETMTDEQFQDALYAAWKEWAWNYIDGGPEKL